MALKDIRREFVEWSGRADLMNADGSDRGADKFIRAASDRLDEETDRPKQVARHIIDVDEGDYSAEIPRCLGIPQVWVMSATTRYALEFKTLAWIRKEYNEPWASTDNGVPAYFCLNVVGLDGSQFDWDADDELDGLYDVADVHSYDADEAAAHFEYNGLLWMPPASSTLTMNLFGNFYEKKLTLDTDINYWTVCKPLVLVAAACREHEASLRNTAGWDDWNKVVDYGLEGVDKAEADTDSASTNEMEG